MQEHDPGPDGPFVISSLVVHAHTGSAGGVVDTIRALDGVEIVKAIDDKFAVVLETKTTEEAAALTERIQSTEGVTGIELVAHFFEDEVLDDVDPSEEK